MSLFVSTIFQFFFKPNDHTRVFLIVSAYPRLTNPLSMPADEMSLIQIAYTINHRVLL